MAFAGMTDPVSVLEELEASLDGIALDSRGVEMKFSPLSRLCGQDECIYIYIYVCVYIQRADYLYHESVTCFAIGLGGTYQKCLLSLTTVAR